MAERKRKRRSGAERHGRAYNSDEDGDGPPASAPVRRRRGFFKAPKPDNWGRPDKASRERARRARRDKDERRAARRRAPAAPAANVAPAASGSMALVPWQGGVAAQAGLADVAEEEGEEDAMLVYEQPSEDEVEVEVEAQVESSGAPRPPAGTAAVPVAAAAAAHACTSGGPAAMQPGPAAMPADASTDEARLDKLTALYTAGRITKEVYEGKQREVLKAMGL